MNKQIMAISLLIFFSAVLLVIPLFSQEAPFAIYGPEEEFWWGSEGYYDESYYISSLCVNSSNNCYFWEVFSHSSPYNYGTEYDLFYVDSQNTPHRIINDLYNEYIEPLTYIAPNQDGILILHVFSFYCYWQHYDPLNSFTNSPYLTYSNNSYVNYVRQINEDNFLLLVSTQGSFDYNAYCVDSQMHVLWTRYIPWESLSSAEDDYEFIIKGMEQIDSTRFALVVGYDQVMSQIFDDRIIIFDANPDVPLTTFYLTDTYLSEENIRTFSTKLPGTFLFTYKNEQNVIRVLKCTVSSIEEIVTLNEPGYTIGLDRVAATGDSTGILVIYQFGLDLKLTKYALDGDIIWTQTWENVVIATGYNTIHEVIDITDSGNYILGLYSQGCYVLTKVMSDGQQVVANEDEILPVPDQLWLACYPNPFASSVNITLQSKSVAPVQIGVYNIRGQLIKALFGSKSLTWDGSDMNDQQVSNGVYIIKAEQNARTITSKVIRINS